MSNSLPTLFLSHGAPDLLLNEPGIQEIWRQTAQRLPRPEAIVVVSAHWLATPVGITADERPETIHDFHGFPDPLYELHYPAPGDPVLAREIEARLRSSGLAAQCDPVRGLDHGAWVPLRVMYPRADIPVVQVSLPSDDLEAGRRLGEALAFLRESRVLILGSGGSVHNLRELNRTNQPEAWADGFETWLLGAVESGDIAQLVEPDHYPSTLIRAHPTREHLAPLPVVWGAADRGRRIHHGFTYGNLGMSMFEFV